MQELLTRSQAAEEAENQASNPSPNPTMGEIIAARYSRRDLLRGGLAVTAISATVAPLALAVADKARADTNTPTFTFKEVSAGSDDSMHVAEGYDADVLIRWGDPVLPGRAAVRSRTTRPPPRRHGSSATTTTISATSRSTARAAGSSSSTTNTPTKS